jgi:pSer/pThr/pTyr-binding forkhead associated (FHA) protein
MAVLVLGVHAASVSRRDLGDLTRLGTASDNDICLATPGVLGHHARLVRNGTAFDAEPVDDGAELSINGARVARARLAHLDVLSLGPALDLVFLEAAQPDALATATSLDRAVLRWINGPNDGEEIELSRGETPVGRAPDHGVRVDAPSVSRVHARFAFSSLVLTIQDAQSANGTDVNGRRITEITQLADGDRVTFGRDRTALVQLFWREGRTAALASIASSDTKPDPQSDGATIFDVDWQARLAAPPTDRTMAEPRRAVPDPPVARQTDAGATTFGRQEPIAPPPSGEATSLGRAEPIDAPPSELPPTLLGGAAPIAPPAVDDDTPTFAGRETLAPNPIAGARLVGAESSHEITFGTTTVGRTSEAGLPIESRAVSRKHALLRLTTTQLTVQDVGGSNGTFVNGERLQEQRALEDGDMVAFAEVSFAVELRRQDDPS